MLHRSRDHNPLPRGRALLLSKSKCRTENKETVAMKNILQTIRHWQSGKAAARMLNRFDDRLLGDIGIARGDIKTAVHIFH